VTFPLHFLCIDLPCISLYVKSSSLSVSPSKVVFRNKSSVPPPRSGPNWQKMLLHPLDDTPSQSIGNFEHFYLAKSFRLPNDVQLHPGQSIGAGVKRAKSHLFTPHPGACAASQSSPLLVLLFSPPNGLIQRYSFSLFSRSPKLIEVASGRRRSIP